MILGLQIILKNISKNIGRQNKLQEKYEKIIISLSVMKQYTNISTMKNPSGKNIYAKKYQE